MSDLTPLRAARGRLAVVSVLMMALLGWSGCGDGGDEGGPAARAFELSTSPEFVNRVIPGRRPLALVTATGDGSDVIELGVTIDVDGVLAEVQPAELAPGGVAEIWVEVADVAQEVPFRVTVTGTRGAEERTVTIDATAVPGADDLGATAVDIAGVFIDELAGTVDDLPATTSELVNGTPVAGLLVVSHYAWFTDTAEIGLAWHIMVAPDDWAELTIRPRDELAPTRAFRLDSWSTALAGDAFQIDPIEPPPPEVAR
jgi:hypothetical protein